MRVLDKMVWRLLHSLKRKEDGREGRRRGAREKVQCKKEKEKTEEGCEITKEIHVNTSL